MSASSSSDSVASTVAEASSTTPKPTHPANDRESPLATISPIPSKISTTEPSLFATESLDTSSSSNTAEVVVYNVTTGKTTNYTVDGIVQDGSGSKNTDSLSDGRVWVRNDTKYAPWNSEFSPIVNVGGCTGALVGEYHVLTAAHCVYNISRQEWTADVTVSPGAEKVGAETTRAYGTADVVLVRTYGEWVYATKRDREATLHDMALLTIDRPLGERAGTLDFAYEGGSVIEQAVYDDSRVDIAGYPAQPSKVGAPTPTLWWDHGNTTGDLCETNWLVLKDCYEAALTYDVYTSDGQSGSPVIHNPDWVDSGDFLTSNATILAVHAYGDETDNGNQEKGYGPRITPNRSEHIELWIATDDAATGNEDFAYNASTQPALSFASVETTPQDEWYDWERTDPPLEAVNNTTLRYERDVVNIGTESFSGTITVDVYSAAVGDFEVTKQVDKLAPGESVPIGFERRVTGGPGDAEVELILRQPDNGSTTLTTYPQPTIIVRTTGDAWYGPQYDARQTGYNPHTTAPTGPGVRTAWNVSLNDDGWTSVGVKNNTVYAVSQNATLYAINSDRGEVAWQTRVATGHDGVNEAGVAVGHGNVYVGVDDSATNATIYAINTTSHDITWTVDGHGPRIDGVAVTDSYIYAHAGGLSQIDPESGTVLTNTSSIADQGDPAVLGNDQLAVAQGGNVTGYTVGSGSIGAEWSVDIGRLAKGVTFDDEFLFARDGNDSLYAIDYEDTGADGEVVWKFTTGATADEWNPEVEPILVNDRVVIGDNSGTLYALSTANGVAHWTQTLSGGIRTVAAANGTIYATTTSGEVYAVDADDGTVLWTESAGSIYANPAAVNGRVIVPTVEGDTGRVIALKTSSPSAEFYHMPSDPHTKEEVAFNASTSTAPGGIITEYAWDFDNDGTTDATGTNVSHSFESAGNYPVTLTVTTSEGATNTTTQTVTVTDKLRAEFTHTPTHPVITQNEEIVGYSSFYAQTITFNASNSTNAEGDITGYDWTFYENDRQSTLYPIDKSGQVVSFTPNYPANISVEMTVTGENGSTDTITRWVDTQTNRNPIVAFDVETDSPALGEPIELNASRTRDTRDNISDNITAYEWRIRPQEEYGSLIGAELDGYTEGRSPNYRLTGFVPASTERVNRRINLTVIDEHSGRNRSEKTITANIPANQPVLDIGNGTVVENDTVSIPVILTKAPDGVYEVDIGVDTSNGTTATVTDLDTSAYALIYSDYGRIEIFDTEPYSNEFRPGDRNITLFTVTIRGNAPGRAELNVTYLDDFTGENFTHQSGVIDPGYVNVTANPAPSVNVTLGTSTTNVGSPLEVSVNASDVGGNVTNVTLQTPNDKTLGTANCNAPTCSLTLSGTPATSTWNGSAYEPVQFTVIVTDDVGETTTATVKTSVYIAGDTNGDGSVNIFDAVEVGNAWQSVRGGLDYDSGADLNNDGHVDILDAIAIGNNWQDSAG